MANPDHDEKRPLSAAPVDGATPLMPIGTVEQELARTREALRLAGIRLEQMATAAASAAAERQTLLDNERSARAEAERSNHIKDEFLATLSHELRTPLTAILGWAQVLRRGTRDLADLHRGLQTIERNARAQAQLIEDLLDMGRIASGKVLLEIAPLAPEQLLDRAIDAVRAMADAKHIRIAKHYKRAGGHIGGDPERLHQVFWNLLSNAVKFTPRDGIIQVSMTAESNGVTISISDSGSGIRPEFLDHVFERFRQADASTTRQHGGLGLGLSIVKHLVEQHGGAVSARSEGEGQGASFTVQLPFQPDAGAAPVALSCALPTALQAVLAARDMPPHPTAPSGLRPIAPSPAPAPLAAMHDLRGLQVLVVDDDADARALIRRVLTDCHASVTTAANAPQALQALQTGRIDVLISDIGMPDVDGYGLLARLRAAGATLPAIALTAFARPNDRRKALDAGFSAHLAKPVEPSLLVATIAALSGLKRSMPAHQADVDAD
jgi:signal transduction histidine kinase/CheY-like chemotaxis protein